MFTGLIEEVGVVREVVSLELGLQLTVCCKKVLEGTKLGDSISVSGVCLTIVKMDENSFTADVMHETIRKTTIASYGKGTYVNLERALAAGQRMGGHYVQGHVDGLGTITEKKEVGNATLFRIQVTPQLTHWMVEKGSIAVNGISLTIVDTGNDFFDVSIIPHTLTQTTLGHIGVGDIANIECDIVGKYVAKWTMSKEESHV